MNVFKKILWGLLSAITSLVGLFLAVTYDTASIFSPLGRDLTFVLICLAPILIVALVIHLVNKNNPQSKAARKFLLYTIILSIVLGIAGTILLAHIFSNQNLGDYWS